MVTPTGPGEPAEVPVVVEVAAVEPLTFLDVEESSLQPLVAIAAGEVDGQPTFAPPVTVTPSIQTDELEYSNIRADLPAPHSYRPVDTDSEVALPEHVDGTLQVAGITPEGSTFFVPTHASLPEPSGYTPLGVPYYSAASLAKSLTMHSDRVRQWRRQNLKQQSPSSRTVYGAEFDLDDDEHMTAADEESRRRSRELRRAELIRLTEESLSEAVDSEQKDRAQRHIKKMKALIEEEEQSEGGSESEADNDVTSASEDDDDET